MRKLAVGAIVALGLATAACGGGGSKTLSKEEYGSQLNAICQDANKAQKEIGTPSNLKELVTKGPQLRDAFNAAVAKAEKLKPPSELKANADKFISEVKELRDLITQLIDAARATNLQKVQEIGLKADALQKDVDSLAPKLGAPACATQST